MLSAGVVLGDLYYNKERSKAALDSASFRDVLKDWDFALPDRAEGGALTAGC